jgi:hypothetical protein
MKSELDNDCFDFCLSHLLYYYIYINYHFEDKNDDHFLIFRKSSKLLLFVVLYHFEMFFLNRTHIAKSKKENTKEMFIYQRKKYKEGKEFLNTLNNLDKMLSLNIEIIKDEHIIKSAKEGNYFLLLTKHLSSTKSEKIRKTIIKMRRIFIYHFFWTKLCKGFYQETAYTIYDYTIKWIFHNRFTPMNGCKNFIYGVIRCLDLPNNYNPAIYFDHNDEIEINTSRIDFLHERKEDNYYSEYEKIEMTNYKGMLIGATLGSLVVIYSPYLAIGSVLLGGWIGKNVK